MLKTTFLAGLACSAASAAPCASVAKAEECPLHISVPASKHDVECKAQVGLRACTAFVKTSMCREMNDEALASDQVTLDAWKWLRANDFCALMSRGRIQVICPRDVDSEDICERAPRPRDPGALR